MISIVLPILASALIVAAFFQVRRDPEYAATPAQLASHITASGVSIGIVWFIWWLIVFA